LQSLWDYPHDERRLRSKFYDDHDDRHDDHDDSTRDDHNQLNYYDDAAGGLCFGGPEWLPGRGNREGFVDRQVRGVT
jgi:hypothetical protein